MEAAAIRKVGQDPEHADEAPEVSQALLELKRIGIFNEIDKQLLIVSHATAALIETQAYPVVTISDAARLKVHEISVPSQNRRWVSHEPHSGRGLRLTIVIGALLVALGLGWFGGSNLYRYFDRRDELTGGAAINAVVERIIGVELDGDPTRRIVALAQQDSGNF